MLDWSEPSAAARHAPPSIVLNAGADQTGLGTIDRHGGRVSVDDKRMINCRADVNQLLPLMATAPDLSNAVACSIDNPECEACQ